MNVPESRVISVSFLREFLGLPAARPDGVRDLLVIPRPSGAPLPGPWRLALGHWPDTWRAAPSAAPRFLVVLDGLIVSAAGNRTITDCDPTAHAEIVARRDGARKTGNYRLIGATLFVTVEPCAMCAGALVQARVARLVYGADEPKGGAIRTCMQVLDAPMLNHRVEVVSGVLASESVQLLQSFFAARR